MSRKKPNPKVRKQIPGTTPGNPTGRVERMSRRAKKAIGRAPPVMAEQRRPEPALGPTPAEEKRPGMLAALQAAWKRLTGPHVPVDMNPGESPLERFMQQIAGSMEQRGHGDLSVHGFVLRRGRRFESHPLTPEEWEYLELADWRRHQQRQCWRNAQVTALVLPTREGMTLRYAEGFLRTTRHDFGVAHAWTSLNGKVVDTTARTDPDDPDSPRVMGEIPPDWEYWGVELDPGECTHYIEQHTEIGSLLDDYQCGWPILIR